MKKNSKKKIARKKLGNLFANDALLANYRESIRHSESLEIDKPDHFYSWNKKFTYAMMILVSTALDHLPQDERVKVLVEAGVIHRRIGVAMLEKREVVDRCLCKNHDECMGRYASVYVKNDVMCKCPCHQK
jgi:hypothetical protein